MNLLELNTRHRADGSLSRVAQLQRLGQDHNCLLRHSGAGASNLRGEAARRLTGGEMIAAMLLNLSTGTTMALVAQYVTDLVKCSRCTALCMPASGACNARVHHPQALLSL